MATQEEFAALSSEGWLVVYEDLRAREQASRLNLESLAFKSLAVDRISHREDPPA